MVDKVMKEEIEGPTGREFKNIWLLREEVRRKRKWRRRSEGMGKETQPSPTISPVGPEETNRQCRQDTSDSHTHTHTHTHTTTSEADQQHA